MVVCGCALTVAVANAQKLGARVQFVACDLLAALAPEWVVLAGYMRIVGPAIAAGDSMGPRPNCLMACQTRSCGAWMYTL